MVVYPAPDTFAFADVNAQFGGTLPTINASGGSGVTTGVHCSWLSPQVIVYHPPNPSNPWINIFRSGLPVLTCHENRQNSPSLRTNRWFLRL